MQSDNTTAVAYINSRGGVKSEECNDMALQIWSWCLTKGVWLSARHIPGAQNTEANQAPRQFKESVECSLSTGVFQTISTVWGPFDMGLIASRLNNKLASYASWSPDPGAQFTDAFCFNWKRFHFYAFPPFIVISKCLQKIEKAGAQHPLRRKMRLLACKLSGQVLCRQMFLAKQQTLSCIHGRKAQLSSTVPPSERGLCCVVNGISIPMTHL